MQSNSYLAILFILSIDLMLRFQNEKRIGLFERIYFVYVFLKVNLYLILILMFAKAVVYLNNSILEYTEDKD